ncbi:hypothetical protein ABPG75_008613 [Micractinium tetrahymenae]
MVGGARLGVACRGRPAKPLPSAAVLGLALATRAGLPPAGSPVPGTTMSSHRQLRRSCQQPRPQPGRQWAACGQWQPQGPAFVAARHLRRGPCASPAAACDSAGHETGQRLCFGGSREGGAGHVAQPVAKGGLPERPALCAPLPPGMSACAVAPAAKPAPRARLAAGRGQAGCRACGPRPQLLHAPLALDWLGRTLEAEDVGLASAAAKGAVCALRSSPPSQIARLARRPLSGRQRVSGSSERQRPQRQGTGGECDGPSAGHARPGSAADCCRSSPQSAGPASPTRIAASASRAAGSAAHPAAQHQLQLRPRQRQGAWELVPAHEPEPPPPLPGNSLPSSSCGGQHVQTEQQVQPEGEKEWQRVISPRRAARPSQFGLVGSPAGPLSPRPPPTPGRRGNLAQAAQPPPEAPLPATLQPAATAVGHRRQEQRQQELWQVAGSAAEPAATGMMQLLPAAANTAGRPFAARRTMPSNAAPTTAAAPMPPELPAWDAAAAAEAANLAACAVAAAAATGEGAERSLEQDEECAMCMDAPPQTLLVPCNHRVLCLACTQVLRAGSAGPCLCPICRQEVESCILRQFVA